MTRGKIEASRPEILNEPLTGDAVRLEASTDHKANFFDCVRTRRQPICTAEIGHRSASVGTPGRDFDAIGPTIGVGPAREQFINDSEADKWMSREQRKPWSYE